MHHNPKLPNLVALAEWFEAGAPGWTFDMRRGLEIPLDDLNRPIENDCGTTGCIAGAAFAMSLAAMTPIERARQFRKHHIHPTDGREYLFDGVAYAAADWLGLEVDPNAWYKHDLFDPHGLCRVTPADAARAIRNVIAGVDPWAWKRYT
jgi:hypothetical protein